MTIKIVDFPMNNGNFPVRYVSLPGQGVRFRFDQISTVRSVMKLSAHSVELTIG
jgi:hypothetical protein